jgi:hypothetical protein
LVGPTQLERGIGILAVSRLREGQRTSSPICCSSSVGRVESMGWIQCELRTGAIGSR